MMTMVAFGVGEIIGSFIVGAIIDKYGSKTTSIYNVIMAFLSAVITIVFL